MLRAKEIVFPKAQHTKRLSHTKRPSLKTDTPIILYRLSCIFRNIHVYACISIYVTAISEKRGHEFERELEGIRGRILRKEREGVSDMIIL